jgi:pyruvate carboxylase
MPTYAPVRHRKHMSASHLSFVFNVSAPSPQYQSDPKYLEHLNTFIKEDMVLTTELERNTVYVSINRHSCAVDGLQTAEKLGISHRIAIFDSGDEAAGNAHIKYATESHKVKGYTDRPDILHVLNEILMKNPGKRVLVDPGYGFLAENEDFVKELERLSVDHGDRLVFTGPTAEAMSKTSSKLSFRQLCAQQGLPTIPGMNESSSLLGVRKYFELNPKDELLRFEIQGESLMIFKDRLSENPNQVDKEIQNFQKSILKTTGERILLTVPLQHTNLRLDLDVLGLIYASEQPGLQGSDLRVKATEAGGGTGQRIIKSVAIETFKTALAGHGDISSAHEVLKKKIDEARIEGAGFGSSELIIEKNLAKGAFEKLQHVELQVVCDGKGGVLILDGARNCSFQAGDSKKFEEYLFTDPAGLETLEAIKPALRKMLAGYRGAGTLEFMYDPVNKQFYLMEMNTRKQVEHKVTEDVARMSIPALEDLVASGVTFADLGLQPNGTFKSGSVLDKMDQGRQKDPTVFCGQLRVNTETHSMKDGAYMPTSSLGRGLWEHVTLPKTLPQGVYVPGYCVETGQRYSTSGDTNIMRVLISVTQSEVQAESAQHPGLTPEGIARELYYQKVCEFLTSFSIAGPSINWIPLLNAAERIRRGENLATLEARTDASLYSLESIPKDHPVRKNWERLQTVDGYLHGLADIALKESSRLVKPVRKEAVPTTAFNAKVTIPQNLPQQPSLMGELQNRGVKGLTEFIRNENFELLTQENRGKVKVGWVFESSKGERFLVGNIIDKKNITTFTLKSLETGATRSFQWNSSMTTPWKISPPRPVILGATNFRDHSQSTLDNFLRLADADPSMDAMSFFQNMLNEVGGGAVPARDSLTGVDTGEKFEAIVQKLNTLVQCLFRGTGLGYENQSFDAMKEVYKEYIKAGCTMPRLFDACGILDLQQFADKKAQLGLDDGKTIQDFPNLRKSILALCEAMKELDAENPGRLPTMPILDVTYTGELASGDTIYNEEFYRNYVRTLIRTAEEGGLKPGSYVIGIKDMAGQGTVADIQALVRIIRLEYAAHYPKDREVLVQLHVHAPTDEADTIAALSGADIVHVAFRGKGPSTSQPSLSGVLEKLNENIASTGQVPYGDFSDPAVKELTDNLNAFWSAVDKEYACMHVDENVYSALLGPLGCRFFRVPGGQSMTLISAASTNKIPVGSKNDIRVLGWAYAFADMILAENDGLKDGFATPESLFKRLSLVTPTSQAANNLAIELAQRLEADWVKTPPTYEELGQAESIIVSGDISSLHPQAQKHGYNALLQCQPNEKESLRVEIAKIIRLNKLSKKIYETLKTNDADQIRALKLADKTIGDFMRGAMGIPSAVGLPSYHKAFMEAYTLTYPSEVKFSVDALKAKLKNIGISEDVLTTLHPLTLLVGNMLPADNFATVADFIQKYGHINLTLYQSLHGIKEGEETAVTIQGQQVILKRVHTSRIDDATKQQLVTVEVLLPGSKQPSTFVVPVTQIPYVPVSDVPKPFAVKDMSIPMKPLSLGENQGSLKNLTAAGGEKAFGFPIDCPVEGGEFQIGTRSVNKKESPLFLKPDDFHGLNRGVFVPLRKDLSALVQKAAKPDKQDFTPQEITTSAFLPTQAAFGLVSVEHFRALVTALDFGNLLDSRETEGFSEESPVLERSQCLNAIVKAIMEKNSKI